MDGGSLQGAVPAEGTARVFVEAKEKAIEIMSDMEEKVNKVDEKLSEFTERGIDLEIIEDTKRWCTETNAFFNKGKMKVVVFGSTSSGKSTTVNAILHKRVLESGMGHVTNCIFQIQGSKDKNETTFKINKGTIEEKIEDLKEYLLPGSNKVLDCDSVVYITCPIADGSQISPDVIILDCPGLDKSDEHDEVLFNHCKDADVFVFVADAKIGIRKTELSFFKTIGDPAVFVLFNCWDSAQRNATDRERAPYVRGKLGKDALEFLKTTNQHFDESKNRIYFVSAEEYLEKCEQERGKLLVVIL